MPTDERRLTTSLVWGRLVIARFEGVEPVEQPVIGPGMDMAIDDLTGNMREKVLSHGIVFH